MLQKKTFNLWLIIGFALLLNFSLNAQDKEDEVIKVETSLVNIPVIVSDRDGRHISGLKTENFTIFEDGKQQKIEYFVSEESPINVAILLDTSRSTQEVLGEIKDAAFDFISQLRPTDRAMIVTFDNDVQFLSELTADRRELENAIYNAEIGDWVGTVLHDAVYEVVDRKFASVKGRKAIIMLTDGKDAGSNTNKPELMYRLEESDTLVYSIFYETGNMRRRFNNRFPDRPPQRNRRGRMGRQNRFPNGFPNPNEERVRQRVERNNEQAAEFLQEIADATAGRIFQTEVTDLNNAFSQIANELRKQYLIGYYPEGNKENKDTRQIKVRVNKNNVVVRAKSSYRAKPSE